LKTFTIIQFGIYLRKRSLKIFDELLPEKLKEGIKKTEDGVN
jgi:hypothetical protein